jgi:hypothetical protein
MRSLLRSSKRSGVFSENREIAKAKLGEKCRDTYFDGDETVSRPDSDHLVQRLGQIIEAGRIVVPARAISAFNHFFKPQREARASSLAVRCYCGSSCSAVQSPSSRFLQHITEGVPPSRYSRILGLTRF